MFRSFTIGVGMSLLAPFALAADGTQSGLSLKNISAGPKLGIFLIDAEVDSATALGFQVSYRLNELVSFDVEYMGGNTEGDFGTPINADVDINTIAGYSSYRSSDQIYWMGKIGLVRQKLEANSNTFGISVSESDTGLSFGIGGGYRVNEQFRAELEYTVIESDNSFLGATVAYLF